MNIRAINTIVAVIGILVAFPTTIVIPMNFATQTEINYINEEVTNYKNAYNLKYVELEAPEYKAILNKGTEVFLATYHNKLIYILPITATICLLLSIVYANLHYAVPLTIMSPAFLAVMFSGINPLLWVISVLFACSGIYLRKLLKKHANK